MREILFRGKTHDGDWRESSAVFIRGELAIMLNERPIKEVIKDKNGKSVDVIFSFCAVEKNTVGQYTGLTDKNGKKIFEGDIVKFHTETYTSERDTIGKIEYFNGAFGISYENDKHFLEFINMSMYVRWYEVIGNIHDNPELLKEKENGDNT